ncbi:MAG TPA: Ku protein [Methylomirabilota bacterium]|nr:Ku protein [Methylomirabilota bacterium]
MAHRLLPRSFMAPRALGSGTISLGLVAIPVRLYPAAVPRRVSFHFLHAKCGSRVRTQWFCPVCERVVTRDELVRGYEMAKGRFVRMTDEELDALAGKASKEIELSAFVPLESVDPVYLDEAYYLGADRGAGRPYRLLESVLTESGRAGVARFVYRGKESLVLIRAAKGGPMLLHTMYFGDEIRDAGAIPRGEAAAVKPAELKLARRLVDELARPRFEPSKYEDEYRERVLKAIRRKATGKAAPAPEPSAPRGKVIDLMDALQKSLGRGGKPAARDGRPRPRSEKKGVKATWRSSGAGSAGRASTRSAS